MEKSLDRKLAAIHADPSGSKEFILADAKDADMAFGVGAPGRSPEMHAGEVRLRTLAEYREQIRQIARQGLIDIMLMSTSNNQILTIDEGLFETSHVTPAARANDASDVFAVRHGRYLGESARPFRTALLDHIQCGHVDCDEAERARGANLGLYSVTFNNRLDEDLVTLDEYKSFREEAEQKGFRHFFEVFDPNNPEGLTGEQIPQFVNDTIARTLAGVATAGRPIFLKVVYHGPKSMEELVTYDPHLIVGILGGSAGTTYDAFKLLAEAQKYGARAALFGRKINSADCQLAFVEFLRRIANGEISPEEAVKAYHSVLGHLKIKPQRSLEDDMQLQSAVMSYGSSSVSVPHSLPIGTKAAGAAAAGRASGERASGERASGERASGERASGERASGERASGERASGERASGERASGERASGERASAGPSGPAHACGCAGAKPHACSCPDKTATTSAPATSSPAASAAPAAAEPTLVDFARMSVAEKLAYNKAKRDRIFG